jgi:hypothetical protein
LSFSINHVNFPLKLPHVRTILSSLFFAIAITSIAQTETFDIATYTPPATWKKEVKETFVTYTEIKQNSGAFCVLGVYTSKNSSGNVETDFATDWQELVMKPFSVTEKNPATEKQTTPQKFEAIAAVSPISFNGATAYVLLTTFTGFGKTTSILATLNDQSYLTVIDNFLQTLSLDTTIVTTPAPAIETNSLPSIPGKWAKSASSPSRYINGKINNMAYNGYYKGQYDFKKDGTYTFIGESYNGLNEFGLIDEKGKYVVKGQQIIITPASAKMRVTDLNGKLKKSQTLAVPARTYTWQVHYFEGIQEYNLVLTSAKENIIDGGFSGNSLFPSSFLYSIKYKPEFRFNR